MSIPGQRQHGQPHPPIDIISDRRRLNRTITLGPVRQGSTPIEALLASNSSAMAATQLKIFLDLCWGNKPNDKVVTVTFKDVDQQAEYILPEAPHVDLSGYYPVRMIVTRGLAGPSTMTEDGHPVVILSDVEIVLTMKHDQMYTQRPVKLNARHFTVRADGVIMVHT